MIPDKIIVGTNDTNYSVLEEMAKKKAKSMRKKLHLIPGEAIEVGFWTAGIPEHIGIAKFTGLENNRIDIEWDWSNQTVGESVDLTQFGFSDDWEPF